MMDVSSKYWFVLVILAGVSCDDPCQLRHFNGTCKIITSCPFAIALLNIKDIQMLRDMWCGNDNGTPKLCCPITDGIIFRNESNEKTISDPPSTPKIEITSRFSDYVEITTENIINTKPSLFPDRNVCGLHTLNLQDRIVGGEMAGLNEFPWLVRLKYRNSGGDEYTCSGNLITDRHVLTTAHCINRQLMSVRLGEWDETTEIDCIDGVCNDVPIDRDIETAIRHPKFNSKNFTGHDIGIIQLRTPVNFTDSIKPICLPTTPFIARQDYLLDVDYVSAGWGVTEYGVTSSVKRKVNLRAFKFSLCQKIFKNLLPDSEKYIICAGGEKGKDNCHGDSGGPLMRELREDFLTNWYLFGITSSGRQCAKEGVPGIYTRVSNYMDWIRQNVT